MRRRAEFPTAEQLARTDVLLIYTADGGDLNAAQREGSPHCSTWRRSVTVLDGVCGHDPQWWKTITGVAWEYGHTKWVYTKLTLRFRDTEHPVTKNAANFKLDDELYDGLHVIPEAHVLAESEFSPKDAVPRSVPQVWALEKGGYREFTIIPRMRFTTFSVPSYRGLLLRGIAWAGRREKVDEFCSPDELAACEAWPNRHTNVRV